MSTKISQLTSAVDVTANDLIQIVDVEDGVMAPSGTNKKATASLLAKELAKQPLEPGVVISGSSSSDAVRITQTGAGNALVVEDSTNPDASPFAVTGDGRVGVGTNSPQGKLDIRDGTLRLSTDNNKTALYGINRGDTSSVQGMASIGMFGSGTNGFLGNITFRTAESDTFDAMPTERMRITSAGNVGIGTSSPTNKLVLNTSVQYDGFVLKNGTNTVGYITGNTANNDDGQLSLNSGGTNVVTLLANGASFLNGGNVGIGTSSPSAKLHVSINAAASEIGILSKNTSTAQFAGATQALVGPSTTSSRITHYNVNSSGSEGAFAIQKGDSTGAFAATIADYLYSSDIWRFFTAGVERLRIDSTGNVGIGTNSPSYQLQLSTDSAAKPSTSTWTVSSDERLKENIEAADLDICYNAVKSIPLKRYKWKDEIYSAEQVADRSKIGWIAQDVQAVFPKAVGQHKFVYNQVKDEEGNIVSEDSIDDCLSLNSDQLYAALFGAVQKLMGEVESLQDRIAELESAP